MFNYDINTLNAGLKVSLYGLGGVFLVLILFYFVTRLMVSVANKIPQKDEE
jgi:Na+-transporting methylmalonyl-CoA/oxaloacetate decarboxylase gamma subunit